MRKRSILLIAVLISVVVVLFVYREYTRTNESMRQATADFKIPANDLMKEFALGDSAASKKYLGRVIEVKGVVKGINDDSTTITLGNPSDMSSIICSLDTNNIKSQLPSMRSIVTIRGSFNGFNKDDLLGTDLIMNRCIIIK